MKLNLAEWLVIGLSAVLLIGYVGGYYYNRQQAGKIHTWLRANLQKWGTVTLGERLPGMVTGGRLLVPNPAAPFRQIEAVYLLAPRENLVFWLFHLLQSRGDELVLRIHLPKAPRQALEVKRNWLSRLTYQGEAAQKLCEPFLAEHGRSLIHLAVRREAPHFFVRARLSSLMAEPADGFFTSLAELAA